MTRFDVIVIGGGHNGLVAAALLATAGRRVVLLEQRPALGGLAAGDEFHPGFTSGGAWHDTSGVRDAVINGLALGLPRVAPAPIFAPQLPGAGPGLLLHRDPVQAAAEIGTHSTADAGRYADYHAFLGRVRPVLRQLLDAEPPNITGGVTALLPLVRRGVALRRLGRADMTELLRIAPMCLADWLGEWFETELLRCILAAPALAATTAGPWSPGTVANLLRLEALAGPAVVGGAPALIDALAVAAARHGVDVRLETEVTAIRTAAGAVAGVTLTTGETIDADTIVATCDPKTAILGLLPPSSVPPGLHHELARLRTRGTTARVDLAVRGALRFACRPELEIVHAHIGTRIDDMERAADAVKYRRCSDEPVLDVTVPSAITPGLTQDGHHVITINAHYAPHDLDGGWTEEKHEQFGHVAVDTLARYAPDLPDQVVAARLLSPPDLEIDYGVTGGHLHHAEHAIDQLAVRPTPSCARYATPVRGLFLGGSGSHPGGGITGGPGALAAAAVRRGRNRR